MDKEFLMRLYERIGWALEEMRDRICPERGDYWEGIREGIDRSLDAVEKAFKEASEEWRREHG